MSNRPDLAAMVWRLNRALLAMEAPILSEHGVSMWAYSVLNRLVGAPVRGQSVLADAIGADKTRLIEVLDDLQDRGLIRRDPDPDDRRTRILALTPDGLRVRDDVRRAIRREEQRILADVPDGDRAAFLRVLRQLDG